MVGWLVTFVVDAVVRCDGKSFFFPSEIEGTPMAPI